jgi:orotidine-5'-phosphate decarboxylase
MKKENRLIVALDMLDKQNAIKVASQLKGCVDAIKIGYPLVLSAGIGIIKKLSAYAPIIADFKVADIPNTNRLICEQVFKMQASAIIVHGFTGSDSLKECIEVANEMGKEVFVVTEMSHPGGVEFLHSAVFDIAKMAKENKAYGIVAPGTRPAQIRKIREVVGMEIAIISPGIGVQGGSAKDAIDAGADWVIVGRSIYQSDNPRDVALEIVSHIGDL